MVRSFLNELLKINDLKACRREHEREREATFTTHTPCLS